MLLTQMSTSVNVATPSKVHEGSCIHGTIRSVEGLVIDTVYEPRVSMQGRDHERKSGTRNSISFASEIDLTSRNDRV